MKKLSANPVVGIAALVLLFLSVFVLPEFILLTPSSIMQPALPLWVAGALAALACVGLRLAGDAGRQLACGAGAVALLLLKLIHPLQKTMNGVWDTSSVLPGVPAFGDASVFLLGFLAVCGIFGIIACVRAKAIPKGLPLWAAIWVMMAALVGAADSVSVYFSQLHIDGYEGSMLALRIAAMCILLAVGFLTGFLALKKLEMPRWLSIAVAVLAMLVIVNVLLMFTHGLAHSPLYRLLTIKFFGTMTGYGLLLAAGVRCLLRGTAAKAEAAQGTVV